MANLTKKRDDPDQAFGAAPSLLARPSRSGLLLHEALAIALLRIGASIGSVFLSRGKFTAGYEGAHFTNSEFLSAKTKVIGGPG